VGPFGDPLLLVELAVAAEEQGWDGFFVWDHLLYHDQRWDVADPVAVIAAVAARTARIRIGVLVNVLARRRIGEVARESVTVDLLSGERLVARCRRPSAVAGQIAFRRQVGARLELFRLDARLNLVGDPYVSTRTTVLRSCPEAG
jgi:alkanesulfonate monooxygenase SsuD/methylene tetrahydromethanopterin reductase-like flavin-dependent oxidoreductase (luciferase family)